MSGLADIVTLVVPAKGRPDLTTGLLRSLAASEAEYRIFVVDDATEPPLESMVDVPEELHLNWIRNSVSLGPAAARNIGLRLAKTPYVAFTDNDVEVQSGWMEKLVNHLANSPLDVAGVGGSVMDDGTNLVGRYCTKLSLLDPYTYRGRVAYVVTANAVFRREALIKVGGFDERFRMPGGEDPDVSFRLLRAGYRLEHNKKAMVVHHYSPSWLSFMKTFHRYGRGCRMAMEALVDAYWHMGISR
jgi:GT2 family glycosyltransferase